jgi:hypothetical protein
MKLQTLSKAVLALSLGLGFAAEAKDFQLPTLLQASNPDFDLSDVAGKESYFSFVRETVGPKMQKSAPKGFLDNEKELSAGHGISVKLSRNNYNIHVNFPNASLGGRSYGWTKGQVGDWSDAMYLDRLADVVASGDEKDLASFYKYAIKALGACEVQDIESLNDDTQRVAANFLAIYTAEAYRAMVPDAHMNWDDALFEVTMLGAFHSGQKTFTKFYVGEFSDSSKVQNSGVYANGRKGPNSDQAKDKAAAMRDYWQFSANPSSKQSGINLSRADFEKMGVMITKYEAAHKNRALAKVQAIVGGDSKNVIKSIAKFFTTGQSKDVAQIDQLASDVSELLMDIRADAEKITQWELAGEQ